MHRKCQRFTAENIFKAYAPYYTGSDYRSLKSVAHRISHDIARQKYEFPLPASATINKKPVYFFNSLSADIVLRKIDHNIKNCYNIKPTGRNPLIGQLITLSSEPYPKYIGRLDLRDFFESLNFGEIVQWLQSDRRLTRETLLLLSQLRYSCVTKGARGLPRGLPLSSTLSELWLREFDRRLRNAPGIYFYGRYVDDMILVSHKPTSEARSMVQEQVASINLHLNEDKQQHVELCGSSSRTTEKIDYLGYELDVPCNPSHANELNVRIAPKKVNKVKTRIVRALLSFGKNRDFALLRDRVKFLAGHYPIYRANMPRGNLKGGMAYSYPFINDVSQLMELDDFKSRAIYSRSSSFALKAAGSLSLANKREIAKISFERSFCNRRYYGFSGNRLTQIMQAFK